MWACLNQTAKLPGLSVVPNTYVGLKVHQQKWSRQLKTKTVELNQQTTRGCNSFVSQ